MSLRVFVRAALLMLALFATGGPLERAAWAGATWLVPGDAPTIRAAIDAAASGDEIVLVDALYAGPDNRAIDFGGKQLTLRSQSGDPDLCVIDCEHEDDGLGFFNGEGLDTVVSGVTIARAGGGFFGGAGILCINAGPSIINTVVRDGLGTGIYIQNGSPAIEGCRIISNQQPFGSGAGLYNSGGDPTINDCEFIGNQASAMGGAIFSASGDPTISGCSFSGNISTFGGGAVFIESGAPAISDCSFTGNITSTFGGGVSIASGEAVVEVCSFSGNLPSGLHAGGGAPTVQTCTFTDHTVVGGQGALEHRGGAATVSECVFTGNAGLGGFYSVAGTPLVQDCRFEENLGAGAWIEGGRPRIERTKFLTNGAGGLAVYKGAVTALGCEFTGNTGGGAWFMAAQGDLINCTFRANTASEGAGAWCDASAVSFVNCLFVENAADGDGGALLARRKATTTLTNCTIAGNSAGLSGRGGGVHVAEGATADIANTILWGNTTGAAADAERGQLDFESGTWGTIRYSVVEGLSGMLGGSGNRGGDPTFADAAAGDYTPADGSPCVDAGDNTAVPFDEFDIDGDADTAERIPVDLSGGPRFVDAARVLNSGMGDGVNPIVDIGALEAAETTFGPCPSDVNGDGVVNASDLAILLSTWGPGPPTRPADLNSDGEIDASDLAQMLSFWGECGG